MIDTREKLEADVREYYRIGLPGIQETELHRLYYEQVIEWLDRQTAITRDEVDNENANEILALNECRSELHPPKAADMVVVVRCGDCAYSFDGGSRCRKWRTQDCFENSIPEHVEPDGFCKWGERREA